MDNRTKFRLVPNPYKKQLDKPFAQATHSHCLLHKKKQDKIHNKSSKIILVSSTLQIGCQQTLNQRKCIKIKLCRKKQAQKSSQIVINNERTLQSSKEISIRKMQNLPRTEHIETLFYQKQSILEKFVRQQSTIKSRSSRSIPRTQRTTWKQNSMRGQKLINKRPKNEVNYPSSRQIFTEKQKNSIQITDIQQENSFLNKSYDLQRRKRKPIFEDMNKSLQDHSFSSTRSHRNNIFGFYSPKKHKYQPKKNLVYIQELQTEQMLSNKAQNNNNSFKTEIIQIEQDQIPFSVFQNWKKQVKPVH